MEVLGQGAFAHVVRAVDKITNSQVAVKVCHIFLLEIISKKSVHYEKYEQLRKEAKILSSLKHPNIVRLLDVKETDSKILIVMQWVKGGKLYSK